MSFQTLLVYGIFLSILWSVPAWAGKEKMDYFESEPRPFTTIRPYTLSATRTINALHIFESGDTIAEDVEGNRYAIKTDNQPKELRDALQEGRLASLLGHFNLYVTKPGEELKIQLMGGLKGGMKKTNIGGKPHMCHFDKGI